MSLLSAAVVRGRARLPAYSGRGQLAIATATVLAIGATGASAATFITGGNVLDGSLTGRDVKNGSITLSDLSRKSADELAGSTWASGTGAPPATLGRDGDWYLDTATDDAYERVAGAWVKRMNVAGAAGATGASGAKGDAGAKGDTGAAGAAGAKGDAGSAGAKGDRGDAGVKGDTGQQGLQGIQGTTGAPGTPGTPGTPGLKGDRGTVWLQGSGNPTSGDGAVDDWWLNTTTSQAWQKGAGGWVSVVNLRGAKGDTGDDGDAGTDGAAGSDGRTILNGAGAPSGALGAIGDFYFNTTATTLYGPKTGSGWGASVALKGADGSNGDDGENGTSILNGTGAPAAGLGQAGDFYLDTTSTTLYGPKTTTWPGAGVSLIGGGSSGSEYLVEARVSAEQTTPVADISQQPFIVTFANEVADPQNLWNGDTFTAAGSGIYMFEVQTTSKNTGALLTLEVNGSPGDARSVVATTQPTSTSSSYPERVRTRSGVQGTIQLTAGETVQVGAYSNSAVVGSTIDDVPASVVKIIKLG